MILWHTMVLDQQNLRLMIFPAVHCIVLKAGMYTYSKVGHRGIGFLKTMEEHAQVQNKLQQNNVDTHKTNLYCTNTP